MSDFETAAVLVSLARLWIWAGALTALVFLVFGLDRIDPSARGAWAFRPLLVPGVVLLWPLVLWRWFRIESMAPMPAGLPPRAAHRAAWLGLAVLLPALLVGAALHRPAAQSPLAERLVAPEHGRP